MYTTKFKTAHNFNTKHINCTINVALGGKKTDFIVFHDLNSNILNSSSWNLHSMHRG